MPEIVKGFPYRPGGRMGIFLPICGMLPQQQAEQFNSAEVKANDGLLEYPVAMNAGDASHSTLRLSTGLARAAFNDLNSTVARAISNIPPPAAGNIHHAMGVR